MGAATQIATHRFDARFKSLPRDVQDRIQSKIDDLGRHLATYSHYRMEGIDAYRLRVGDYRVIYQVDVARNEIVLVAIGHRRDVYKNLR